MIAPRTYRLSLLSAFLLSLVGTLCTPLVAAPWDLDPTFGNGGQVLTPVGSASVFPSESALQADGSLLVCGYTLGTTGSSSVDSFIIRYQSNGSRDTSFGTAGEAMMSLGTSFEGWSDIAAQTDGRILVAGYYQNGSSYDMALARYLANGTLDATFGTAGKVLPALSSGYDAAGGIVLQPDGKIVVCGGAAVNGSQDFALLRYLSNGTLDTTFGSGGKVLTSITSGDDSAGEISLLADGKIVVAGRAGGGNNSDFALARYLANGTLDTTFGNSGKVITAISPVDDVPLGMTVQPDGKILVSGYGTSNYDLALVRYQSNGALDPSFGTGGKVTTDLGGYHDFGQAVALRFDGEILVGGTADSVVNGNNNSNFALLLYTASGTLDSNFGTGGIVRTPFGDGDDEATGMVLQPDGKIVLTGWGVDSEGYANVAAVRYNGFPAVPEPSSFVLLGAGLAILGMRRHTHARRSK